MDYQVIIYLLLSSVIHHVICLNPEKAIKTREIMATADDSHFDTGHEGTFKRFNWDNVPVRMNDLSRPEANLYYISSNGSMVEYFGCFKFIGSSSMVIGCLEKQFVALINFGNLVCGSLEVIVEETSECTIVSAVVDEKGAIKLVRNSFAARDILPAACNYKHKYAKLTHLSLSPPGEELLVTAAGILTEFTNYGFDETNSSAIYIKEHLEKCSSSHLTGRKLSSISCTLEIDYDDVKEKSTLAMTVLEPGELIISSDRFVKSIDCPDTCSIDVTGSTEVSVTCPNGVQHHLLVERNLRKECYGCSWPVIGFIMLMLNRASAKPGLLGFLILWVFLGSFMVQLMFIIFSWITGLLSWIIGKLVYESDEELGVCQDCRTLFLNEGFVKKHLMCKRCKCPWCNAVIGDGKEEFQKHCKNCREYSIAKHKDIKSCLIKPSKFQEMTQWAEALIYYKVGISGIKWLVFIIIFIICISPSSGLQCQDCFKHYHEKALKEDYIIKRELKKVCRDVPLYEGNDGTTLDILREEFSDQMEFECGSSSDECDHFSLSNLCNDETIGFGKINTTKPKDFRDGFDVDDEMEKDLKDVLDKNAKELNDWMEEFKKNLTRQKLTTTTELNSVAQTTEPSIIVDDEDATEEYQYTNDTDIRQLSDYDFQNYMRERRRKKREVKEQYSREEVWRNRCVECFDKVKNFEIEKLSKLQIGSNIREELANEEDLPLYAEMTCYRKHTFKCMIDQYHPTRDAMESIRYGWTIYNEKWEEITNEKNSMINFEDIIKIESEICGMTCWNGPDVCRCPLFNMTSELDGTIDKELEVLRRSNAFKVALRKEVYEGESEDFLEAYGKRLNREKRSLKSNSSETAHIREALKASNQTTKQPKARLPRKANIKRADGDGKYHIGEMVFKSKEDMVQSRLETHLDNKLHCRDCYMSHRAMIKYSSNQNLNRRYAVLSSLDQIQTDWGIVSINDVYHPTEDLTNTDLTWNTVVKTKNSVKISGIATGKINIGSLSGLTWRISNKDSDEKKMISLFIYDASQVYTLTPKWVTGSRYLSKWFRGVCTGDCPSRCDCPTHSTTCHTEVFDYDRGWNCNPTWCWTAHGGCSCCAVDVMSKTPKWIVERMQVKHIKTQLVFCVRVGTDKLQCTLASTSKKLKIGSATVTFSAAFGEINHLPDEISLVHYNTGSDFSVSSPDEIWTNDRSCKDSCTHGRLGDIKANSLIDYVNGITVSTNHDGIEMNWAGATITHTCHRGDWPSCDYHNFVENIDNEISSINHTADHLNTDYILKSIDYGTDGAKLMVLPRFKTGMIDITLEMSDVVLARKEVKFEQSGMTIRNCAGCFGCTSGFECDIMITAKSYGIFNIHFRSGTKFITIDQNSRTLNLTNSLSTRFSIHGLSMLNESNFQLCVEESNKCETVDLKLSPPQKKLLRKETLVSIKTNDDLNQSKCTGFGWFVCAGNNIARIFTNAWDWISYVFTNGLLWLQIIIPLILIILLAYLIYRIYRVVKSKRERRRNVNQDGYVSAHELNKRIKEKEMKLNSLIENEQKVSWDPRSWKYALMSKKAVRFNDGNNDIEMGEMGNGLVKSGNGGAEPVTQTTKAHDETSAFLPIPSQRSKFLHAEY